MASCPLVLPVTFSDHLSTMEEWSCRNTRNVYGFLFQDLHVLALAGGMHNGRYLDRHCDTFAFNMTSFP